MALTFNSLLRMSDIDCNAVRLLRHKDDKRSAPGKTPYNLWRSYPKLFEDYQSRQSPKKRRGLSSAKYWASFVATPDGHTLFVGLYSSRYIGLGDKDLPWPSNPERIDKAGLYDLYDLEPESAFLEFGGKLVIEWAANAARSWAQYAHKHDKKIIELKERFEEPRFPGHLQFVCTLSEIETLPLTWKTVLENTRGIYLLTCPRTHEQYVGQADGEKGFLQRWREYVQTGHGGNVILKRREPSDYQVSILEVAGTVFDFSKAEGLWKRKLQTREMGLNGN